MISEKAYDDLLNQITRHGYHINDVWELVKVKGLGEGVISDLRDFLPLIENERIKEGIVRALAEKHKSWKSTALVLFDEFHKLIEYSDGRFNSLKWAIGNTISVIVKSNFSEEIEEIILNKNHGIARQMFIKPFAKSNHPEKLVILRQLQIDPDVKLHVESELKRLMKNHLKSVC